MNGLLKKTMRQWVAAGAEADTTKGTDMAKSTAYWIRFLQQYDPTTTTVRFIAGAICLEAPGGSHAKPLFRWYEDGETPQVGDRVRIADYRDVGVIDRLDPATADRRREFQLFHVTWDNTGDSWHTVDQLGKAVE